MTTAELATHLRSLAAVLEAPSDEAIDVIDLAGDVRYLIATWERDQHVGEAVNASGDSNRESVAKTTEAESEIPVDAGAVTVAEQRSSAIPRPPAFTIRGLHLRLLMCRTFIVGAADEVVNFGEANDLVEMIDGLGPLPHSLIEDPPMIVLARLKDMAFAHPDPRVEAFYEDTRRCWPAVFAAIERYEESFTNTTDAAS